MSGKILTVAIAALQAGAPTNGPAPANTPATGGPIQAAWDNHFGAFAAQNVDQILLDYTPKSVIVSVDRSTGARMVYSGLEGVRSESPSLTCVLAYAHYLY